MRIETLIFAKAPVPGQVKTRLSRAVGPTASARIYERLLRRTVEQVVAADLGPVCLVATPDCTHPVLSALLRDHGLVGAVQNGGDLGERMFNAMQDALASRLPCILVGSDCLDLKAGDLRRAAGALRSGVDVVLGPSVDGGYVLIGARRLDRRLFHGIAWSTPGVMEQTRHAILALGWTHLELRWFRDVDVPRDLALIPRCWRVP